MLPSKIIPYPYGCEQLLKCYFLDAADAVSGFELVLVAYAYSTPWNKPANISELDCAGYERITVLMNTTANNGFAYNVAQQKAEVNFVFEESYDVFSPPMYHLTGIPVAVNGSKSVVGAALIVKDGLSPKFMDTQNYVICAMNFIQPIEPYASETDIEIAINLQAGRLEAVLALGQEATIYDKLLVDMFDKYFNPNSTVITPTLEIALISTKNAGSSQAIDQLPLNEVTPGVGSTYTRVTITPAQMLEAVVTQTAAGATIVFPTITVPAAMVNDILGYAIIKKLPIGTTPIKDPVNSDAITGNILAFNTLPTIIPASKEGLLLKITPTISIQNSLAAIK